MLMCLFYSAHVTQYKRGALHTQFGWDVCAVYNSFMPKCKCTCSKLVFRIMTSDDNSTLYFAWKHLSHLYFSTLINFRFLLYLFNLCTLIIKSNFHNNIIAFTALLKKNSILIKWNTEQYSTWFVLYIFSMKYNE